MGSKEQKGVGETRRSQQMREMAGEMRGEGGGLFGDIKKGLGTIKETVGQFAKEQKQKISRVGGGFDLKPGPKTNQKLFGQKLRPKIGIAVRRQQAELTPIPSPFPPLGAGFQGNFSGPVVGNKPNIKPMSGNYSVAGHTQLFEEEAGKTHFHMMNTPRHLGTPNPNTTPSWKRIRTPQQMKLLGKKPMMKTRRVMAAPKNLFGRGTIKTDKFGPLDQ